MSKAYPSNLTRVQYEFLSDMIPEQKPGGRKREVDMWEVLNAIFYVLVEGVRWRCLRRATPTLPGDFPVWQTVYNYFRKWRKDGTWLKIHDSLRQWTRIEQERHRSPIYLAMIRIMVRRLASHPRAPKKTRRILKRTHPSKRPHVSTAKILSQK